MSLMVSPVRIRVPPLEKVLQIAEKNPTQNLCAAQLRAQLDAFGMGAVQKVGLQEITVFSVSGDQTPSVLRSTAVIGRFRTVRQGGCLS
jgi:hypothetical protein